MMYGFSYPDLKDTKYVPCGELAPKPKEGKMGSESLAQALPREQARCRELLVEYKAMGAPGFIGASMIEIALQQADQAVAGGDVIAMIQAYEKLKECD